MELSPEETVAKHLSWDILNYEAPFLIEKLVDNSIVESSGEGRQLFMEVKKWMLLVHDDKLKIWDMYSFRIDAVWHQFILYTEEYIKFCDQYFGTYFSHYPGNAPGIDEVRIGTVGSFDDFEQLYNQTFGTELPDVWYDERNININRHIINEGVGQSISDAANGMINFIDVNGEILLSVNYFAKEAISFITATRAFYVRELPGGLTDGEKISLISCLVGYKILRVA